MHRARKLRVLDAQQLPQKFRRFGAFDSERGCLRGFVGEGGIVHDDEFFQNLEGPLPQKRMSQHEQAILECQSDELGQHVALRVEQQPQRALARIEVTDIPGSDGVEITHAVRAGERENGAEIGIDQRDAVACRGVFGKRIAKLCRQSHSEIFGEFRSRRAMRLKQRSFQMGGFFCVWFVHKTSLAERFFGAGFQRGML